MKKTENKTVNTVKRLFNVRAWLDFDRTKSWTEYLANGFRKMFIPQKEKHEESFKQAVKRLNLDSKELHSRQQSLLYMSILMVFIALGLIVYGVILLMGAHYYATFISALIAVIALVLAFRYHFWYFQIKHQKLGCTVKEWFKQGLLGEKS